MTIVWFIVGSYVVDFNEMLEKLINRLLFDTINMN